jgi:beta-lactamase class A
LKADLKTDVQALLGETSARFSVAIRHIETGSEVMLDADQPGPLASVVKVPALVEAFRQIGAGLFRLDDRWPLTDDVKNVGSTVLTAMDAGLQLTVRDVLTLMIIISDNTATDMLFQRIGVGRVDACMRAFGLGSIHVTHTIRELFDDMLPSGDPNQDRTELARWEATRGVNRGGFAFSTGPENNVGSPRDLARLMEMIYRGELLDRTACDAMLAILLKQQINDRFPRYLPAGTRVAHKTGSISGIRNDAGILYAGDDSHVAFALFATWDSDAVRGDRQAEAAAVSALDDVFGKIGMATYRAFTTG